MGERTGQFGLPGYMGQPVTAPTVNAPGITSGSLNYGNNFSPDYDTGMGGMDSNFTPSTFQQLGTPMPQGVGDVPGQQGGFWSNLLKKGGEGDYGSLEGWGNILGGVGDVAGAYMAYKNYGLATDQFDFQKQVTNRNMANQSIIANAKMKAWAQARGMAVPRTDGSAIG